MDAPSGTQASVPRKPRRKRGSNKNGKQASYRAGLNLQPRNAQYKRTSQQPPQQGSQQLGFFGSVPSLQDLRRENRRNTRRHYRAHGNSRGQALLPSGGNAVPLPAPLSVPPAPFNSTRQALASTLNPLATPALEPFKGGGHGTMFDASGVNFYGSNEGLVLPMDVFPTSSGSSSDDSEVAGARHDCVSTHSPGPSGQHSIHLPGAGHRAPLPEREAYIDRLEDENLRLKERLELMAQELEELRRAAGGGKSAGDSMASPSQSGASHDNESDAGEVTGQSKSVGVPVSAGGAPTSNEEGAITEPISSNSKDD
ncbi:hypothetical protein ACKKBG_A05245 [Auxenochlorella protothecoides x Auxenochlorella symbiontica]